jgi:hypothetical protein
MDIFLKLPAFIFVILVLSSVILFQGFIKHSIFYCQFVLTLWILFSLALLRNY